MKRTLLATIAAFLGVLSEGAANFSTIPTGGRPVPEPASEVLRRVGNLMGNNPGVGMTKPSTTSLPLILPWYYSTNGVWYRQDSDSEKTEHPVRMINGRPEIVGDGDRWLLLEGKVSQVLSKDVYLVMSEDRRMVKVKIGLDRGQVDGDSFSRWVFFDGEAYEYKTVLGAKATVRVYDTGIPADDETVRIRLKDILDGQEKKLEARAKALTPRVDVDAKTRAAEAREEKIRKFRAEQEAKKIASP